MKDWPSVALGDIFEIARGGSPRPIQNFLTEEPDGVNWVMIGDASDSSKYITHTKKRILKTGVKNSRMVYPGDFLLTNSMSFGHPYIMKTSGCIHDGWLVLSNKKGVIDQDYFYHLLGSDLIYAEFSRLASGSTVKNLNIEIVKGIKVSLPPLEEQRRIAAILDKADGVRRKRKEAIRLTKELLRSTFLEMFGDPVTNPKGWEVRELGDCVKDIESGWSPKCDTRQAEPEEWGVLKLGAVTYGHFNPDENKAMLPDDVPRQELEIKTGDLLVTRKNTYELVGASAFVQMTRPKLMLPDLIFRLRLIDGIDPVYVWQTLSQKTMRLKLSGLAGGTAGSMPNISKARLRTLPFPVPPQLLQLKYREIFNQFWLKKEHQKESEEISENLFNSLLQKAFRGEL